MSLNINFCIFHINKEFPTVHTEIHRFILPNSVKVRFFIGIHRKLVEIRGGQLANLWMTLYTQRRTCTNEHLQVVNFKFVFRVYFSTTRAVNFAHTKNKRWCSHVWKYCKFTFPVVVLCSNTCWYLLQVDC